MHLLKLTVISNRNKKEPLLNLMNILKSTTKNVEKGKKKELIIFSYLDML